MRRSTSDEKLIGIADDDLRLVTTDERLSQLLDAGDLEGRSLLDVVAPSMTPQLKLAVRRITHEVVMSCGDGGRTLVARPAVVGEETWLLLFERTQHRSARAGRPPGIVGRRNELAEIDRYLAEPGRSILYVQGPLGIGKTALLSAVASRCDELGCPHFWIDARTLPPTQEAIAHAVTGGPNDRRPLERLDAARKLGAWGWVLVIDNFDAWQDMFSDSEERPCAYLPPECRVVMAARRAPDPRWWGPAERAPRTMRLAVLGREDANELVASLGIRPGDAEEVARRAGGHPLCIVSLASALRAGVPIAQAEPRLDLELAGAGPREVLEAAAIPARITEDVLAALLDDADPSAAFDLLSTIAVPDPAGIGLRMPGIVRDALGRRIRERNPGRYTELQHRLALHVGSQLEMGSSSHLVPVLDDFLDSLDEGLLLQRTAGSRLDGLPPVRRARASDRAEIAAAARAFGGERVAHAVVGRLDHGLAATCIAECKTGIEALCQYVTVSPATAGRLADVRDDSELAAALEVLRRRMTLAVDEYALVTVAWCASDVARGHWGPPSQALFRYLFPMLVSRPQAAATVMVLPSDDFPLPTLERSGADAPIAAGGHSLIYREHRGMSARAMLTGMLGSIEARAPLLLPETALPEAEISTETVREALMLLDRPERLVASRLLSLRMVELEVGADATPTDKASALDRLLRETVAALGTGRDEIRKREALEAVFFERAGKHEKIAADLGMPYSTFRRCLARGIERTVELLRIREQTVRRAATGQR